MLPITRPPSCNELTHLKHTYISTTAQVKRLQQTAATDHNFSIYWVPRRTLVAEKILEDGGVLGDVTSSEWALYFHTLEPDLLSMELDDSYGELSLVSSELLDANVTILNSI